MPTFMICDDNANGTATANGYNGWIEIDAYGLGGSNRNGFVAQQNRKGNSKVEPRPVNVQKGPDEATSEFMLKCLNGERYDKITIVQTRRVGARTRKICEWTLSQVAVEDYDFASTEMGISESYEFAPTKVSWVLYDEKEQVKARGEIDFAQV